MAHRITASDIVALRNKVNSPLDKGWHKLGTPFTDAMTAEIAVERFGFADPIRQDTLVVASQVAMSNLERAQSLYADGRYSEAVEAYQAFATASQVFPEQVANVRTDNNAVMGIVGSDYQICQNRELAEFTDALAQTGQVEIETCGTVQGGRKVWFLARSDVFQIGQDKIVPYVLVSNAHDGTQAIRVTPTTIRVVCDNTLHMVVPREEGRKAENAAITIRHSGKVKDKLQEAKVALRHYGEILKKNQELFNKLAAEKMDEQQARKLFAQVYATNWEAATKDELTSTEEKIKRVAENRMARMKKCCEAFLDRCDLEDKAIGGGGSKWAYMNGLTWFIQHKKTTRGKNETDREQKRQESQLFGQKVERSKDVLDLMLAS